MDNIGDWLYIVLLIVAGVSSIFSSSRKKTPPSEVLGQPGSDIPQPTKKASKGSIWDMFEEIKRAQEQTMERSVLPKTEKKLTEKKKKQTPSPFISEEGANIGIASVAKQKTEMQEIQPDYSQEITINSHEDLRKAIIYSEILNRKY